MEARLWAFQLPLAEFLRRGLIARWTNYLWSASPKQSLQPQSLASEIWHGDKQVLGRDTSTQQTFDKHIVIDPNIKIQLKSHTSKTLAREKG